MGSALSAVRGRPLVVELVGPWGAGKGTLLATIGSRDRFIRVDLDVWSLPRRLLLLGGLQSCPTILGLWRAARRLLWREGKLLIKLQAMSHQLERQRFERYRVAVLDEGPVLALSWLHAFAHPSATNGGLADWWPGALRYWAQAVDIVVLLDAPDAVLTQRIRERPRYHPLQSKPDGEVFEALGRYRTACNRVVSDLRAHGGPTVLPFRTDRQSSAEIADQLFAAFESARYGH